MKFYHVTLEDRGKQKVLLPRVPDETSINENISESRISIAASIIDCLKGLEITKYFEADYGDVIVYSFEIDDNDPNLISWETLYSDGLVNDAALTHEYWYKKPIMPLKCGTYHVSEWTKKRYIVVTADKEIALKECIKSLGLMNETLASYNAFDIMNKWLPLQKPEIQAKVKDSLKYVVVDKTKEEAEFHYKIFKEYPQMTHEEYDFQELPFLETCKIERNQQMNNEEYIFDKCSYEEINRYKQELKLQLSWELLDINYIWNNDSFLYQIRDKDNELVAILYYSIDKPDGVYNLSQFEVLKDMRSKGIGEKIIKQFFKEKNITPDRIRLEPLNSDAARFWRKCGVDCMAPDEFE